MSRELLVRTAHALRPLLQELIFTGGLVVDEYSTVPALSGPRPTIDADVVCSAGSYTEYMKVSSRLKALGFTQPAELNPPPFRHFKDDLTVDLIPDDADILGFTNRWYTIGTQRTITIELEPGLKIRLFDPVVFLAAKLEAFASRGSADPWASHDLDDIIRLVATRPEIVTEVWGAPTSLRDWIRESLRDALPEADRAVLLAIHLPLRLPPGLLDELHSRFTALVAADRSGRR